VAGGLAGCKNATDLFQNQNDGGWFSKPIFQKPQWALPDSVARSPDLGPTGPVGPNDLVSADGQCGATPEMAQAAPPQPLADRPVGSVAGDLASAPMPAVTPGAAPGAPQVLGGIALGITECQALQRAGQPGNVAIGVGERGERSVVLTYLSGPWPGIYRFADGWLKVIERAPVPPEPPKAPPKKKIAKKPVKKPVTQQQ
jgi:hypothetical protein